MVGFSSGARAGARFTSRSLYRVGKMGKPIGASFGSTSAAFHAYSRRGMKRVGLGAMGVGLGGMGISAARNGLNKRSSGSYGVPPSQNYPMY